MLKNAVLFFVALLYFLRHEMFYITSKKFLQRIDVRMQQRFSHVGVNFFVRNMRKRRISQALQDAYCTVYGLMRRIIPKQSLTFVVNFYGHLRNKIFRQAWAKYMHKKGNKIDLSTINWRIQPCHADMTQHRYHFVTNLMIFRHTILLLLMSPSR